MRQELETLQAGGRVSRLSLSSGVYPGAGVGRFNVQIDDIDQSDNAIQRLDGADALWLGAV